jgi:hypothetical protein
MIGERAAALGAAVIMETAFRLLVAALGLGLVAQAIKRKIRPTG